VLTDIRALADHFLLALPNINSYLRISNFNEGYAMVVFSDSEDTFGFILPKVM